MPQVNSALPVQYCRGKHRQVLVHHGGEEHTGGDREGDSYDRPVLPVADARTPEPLVGEQMK
jgi:hypothetical protein